MALSYFRKLSHSVFCTAFKHLTSPMFKKIFVVFLFFLVVGLDDIMDEGVVKESGNDTIDDEELILPNRNLRDKVEENSVRSPRKSPRLMAQGNSTKET